MTGRFDVIVVGSGVAGLTAALRAGELGQSVAVVSKSELADTTTQWAQGGVAAARSDLPNDAADHLADTLQAGADLCDRDAVEVLVTEGPARLARLIDWGARFDRTAVGEFEFSREGGHRVARVVHADGAATGAEVQRALVAATRASTVTVLERHFAIDLVVHDGRCVGLDTWSPSAGVVRLAADHVVLATGGSGQLFSVTTNPAVATGDGVAMALRAGVAVADLEFFQFHPTALVVDRHPRPLLSEALRGDGALLRDPDGERFVDELLPRDVVSRAITQVMVERGVDHVWLDVSAIPNLPARFPAIATSLEAAGLDPASALLPVAPAAHHQCGGVVTDLSGATTLPGLWAVGEVSCSGVHGANRLASNSLLEGLVFGARAVEAISAGATSASETGAMRAAIGKPSDGEVVGGCWLEFDPAVATAGASAESVVDRSARETTEAEASSDPALDSALRVRNLQRLMTERVGMARSAAGLAAAIDELDQLARGADGEYRNLVTVARAMAAAAAQRTETRGAHTRVDHPDRSDDLRVRLVIPGGGSGGL